MKMTLAARPPFSLPQVLQSHGWIQLAPFNSDKPYETFEYVDRLSSGRVLKYQVEPADGGVALTLPGDLAAEEQAEARERVRWMLSLEHDLAPFHDVAREEPKLSHVVERADGRLLRSPTLFEDTVKTILTTNTTWMGTIRMVQALVSEYGEPLDGEEGGRAFPTPERLAEADPGALRAGSKLGYRAPYVKELAERVASGELELQSLKQSELPTQALRKELLAIKGVGGYAAANLLLLLGRTDFIPIDSYAFKLVSQEFYGGAPIGPKEVEAAFERWGEWKGLAYWFWKWTEEGEW